MSPPADRQAPRDRPALPSTEGGRPNLDARFRRLFDRHGEEVFRLFVRLGLSVEDARDLTQETFFRVYQGLKGFRGDASERTWIFSVAQNAFRNTLRHENASKRQGDEVPIDDAGFPGAVGAGVTVLADRAAPDPFESTLTRERRRALRRAIEGLPDRMRHCVLLWVDQDLKYREIADVLGVSIDTVKSQLHQAKERLRSAAGDPEGGRAEVGDPS